MAKIIHFLWRGIPVLWHGITGPGQRVAILLDWRNGCHGLGIDREAENCRWKSSQFAANSPTRIGWLANGAHTGKNSKKPNIKQQLAQEPGTDSSSCQYWKGTDWISSPTKSEGLDKLLMIPVPIKEGPNAGKYYTSCNDKALNQSKIKICQLK